jgi:hypothetical protein
VIAIAARLKFEGAPPNGFFVGWDLENEAAPPVAVFDGWDSEKRFIEDRFLKPPLYNVPLLRGFEAVAASIRAAKQNSGRADL